MQEDLNQLRLELAQKDNDIKLLQAALRVANSRIQVMERRLEPGQPIRAPHVLELMTDNGDMYTCGVDWDEPADHQTCQSSGHAQLVEAWTASAINVIHDIPNSIRAELELKAARQLARNREIDT